MAEEDRADVPGGEPRDRDARRAEVLAAVAIRPVQHAAGVAPEGIAAEQDALARGVETDAAGRMPGRVHDAETTQDRQHLAISDRYGAGHATQGEATRDRARVQANGAVAVGWMQQDIGAGGAAQVVGMGVGDHEARDLRRRAAQRADRGVQPREGATHAGIDDGDLVVEDREARSADQGDRVDPRRDLGRHAVEARGSRIRRVYLVTRIRTRSASRCHTPATDLARAGP